MQRLLYSAAAAGDAAALLGAVTARIPDAPESVTRRWTQRGIRAVSDLKVDSWDRVVIAGQSTAEAAAEKKGVQPTTIESHIADCIASGSLSLLPPAAYGFDVAVFASSLCSSRGVPPGPLSLQLRANLAELAFDGVSAFVIRRLAVERSSLAECATAIDKVFVDAVGKRALWLPAGVVAANDRIAAPALDVIDIPELLSAVKLTSIVTAIPSVAANPTANKNIYFAGTRLLLSLIKEREFFTIDWPDVHLDPSFAAAACVALPMAQVPAKAAPSAAVRAVALKRPRSADDEEVAGVPLHVTGPPVEPAAATTDAAVITNSANASAHAVELTEDDLAEFFGDAPKHARTA